MAQADIVARSLHALWDHATLLLPPGAPRLALLVLGFAVIAAAQLLFFPWVGQGVALLDRAMCLRLRAGPDRCVGVSEW